MFPYNEVGARTRPVASDRHQGGQMEYNGLKAGQCPSMPPVATGLLRARAIRLHDVYSREAIILSPLESDARAIVVARSRTCNKFLRPTKFSHMCRPSIRRCYPWN